MTTSEVESNRPRAGKTVADGAEAGALVGGRYALREVLGEGGMSVVYAAQDTQSEGREVAVKVLRTDRSSEQRALSIRAARRLLREAAALRRMTSPHAVRVVDAGEDTAFGAYVVMERLAGEPLSSALALQGPYAIEDAVRLVVEAADAISEAHSLGVVHRDLKPANLFLVRGGDGRPHAKVIDFGIAKAGEDVVDGGIPADEALTVTGTALGSPRYMAPEQVRNAKNVDGRADVWSLTVTLYELLSGKVPFEGSSASAICAAIVADPPAPLRKHRPSAPIELERLLLRGLEKDAAQRLPDVAALVEGLRPWAPEDVVSLISTITSRADATRVAGPGSTAAGGETAEDLPAGANSPASSDVLRRAVRVLMAAIVVTAASMLALWSMRADSAAPAAPRSHASIATQTSAPSRGIPEAAFSAPLVHSTHRDGASRAEPPARLVPPPRVGPRASGSALGTAAPPDRPGTPTAGPLEDRK